jgi:hypothetical protein
MLMNLTANDWAGEGKGTQNRSIVLIAQRLTHRPIAELPTDHDVLPEAGNGLLQPPQLLVGEAEAVQGLVKPLPFSCG